MATSTSDREPGRLSNDLSQLRRLLDQMTYRQALALPPGYRRSSPVARPKLDRLLSKKPRFSPWVSMAHQMGQTINGSPSKSLRYKYLNLGRDSHTHGIWPEPGWWPMNSLPFLTRLIAATILAKQNKALIAKVAYLRAEIAYLHEQVPKGHRCAFTDRWRKRLARAAAGVGRKRLAEIATVAKASTIRGWHRLLAAGKLGVTRAGPGRAATNPEIEQVVLRMAKENPTWGQMRIRSELLTLGIALSSRTIGAVLDRHGLKPAPQRSTDATWKTFITDAMDKLVATDFFSVDVPGLFSSTTYYVLFAIHPSTRHVEILGVTEHPNTEFML